MPTERQTKQFAAIVSFTGKTFQKLAEEAGITYVPDHYADLTVEVAEKLNSFHKTQTIGVEKWYPF